MKYHTDNTEKTMTLTLSDTYSDITSLTEFPKGTTIALIAQIDDNSPTYWYYYCTNDVSSVNLSDFVQMNQQFTTRENTKYSLTNASGGNITPNTSNRITENLIFIINFENADITSDLVGRMQLKHIYNTGSSQMDIMDYVSEEIASSSESNTSSTPQAIDENGDDSNGGSDESVEVNKNVTYKRSYPVFSNIFTVSTVKTGIDKFKVNFDGVAENETAKYYSKDTIKVNFDIERDNDWRNTQYDEREYSIKLTLYNGGTSDSNNQIAFPEGTEFIFGDESLKAGVDNKSIIISVINVGSSSVEIKTSLMGYLDSSGVNENSELTLKAELYSSSAANYYNNINDNQSVDISFKVNSNPTYQLKAEVANKSDLIVPQGGKLNIKVTASMSEGVTTDEEFVNTQLYLYNSDGETYTLIGKDTDKYIFEKEPEIKASGSGTNIELTAKSTATKGTYRLEFTYGDKVEYLDFIVK